jgi:hypothetical protein
MHAVPDRAQGNLSMTSDLRSFLEDYGDLEEAYEDFLAESLQEAASGDAMAHIARQWSIALNRHITLLNARFESVPLPASLDASWRADARVFVGSAGKRFFTTRVGGRAAVALDSDLLCRLLLFLCLVGMDDIDDVVAPGLGAFILMSIVVPRDEDLTFAPELVVALAHDNERLLSDLMIAVGNFVLYHELGHHYVTGDGRQRLDHLRLVFTVPEGVIPSAQTVQSLQYHPDGMIYNRLDSAGTNAGLMLIHPRLSHWQPEFASDAFSLYADLLAGASGPPTVRDLDRLTSSLCAWQLLLFSIGMREVYLRAASGSPVDDPNQTHPIAHARADVLLHHLDHLAFEFAPGWRSQELTKLNRHYLSLWQKDLRALIDSAVEYVRYGFDAVDPSDGRPDTHYGAAVQPTPSALGKLDRHLVRPLLERAAQVGWRTAVRDHAEAANRFLETFRLNDQPILLQLGRRLRAIDVRFISEDRP